MKLSELLLKDPDLKLRKFRAKYPGTCFACKRDYFGSEEIAGELVIQWNDGVPRHYRCGLAELGVTQRENGLAL